MTLPYTRVVNVSVERNDSFASRSGFGVALFLQSKEIAGVLDASNLTKVYGSIEEVAEDFVTTDDFYKAAVAAFSQNPRPLQIKAGFYAAGSITDAATIQTALNAIVDYDGDWYWLCVESTLRDDAALDGLVDWIGTQKRQAIIDSNDALLQDPSDTTNIAARHKGTTDRVSVYYHTDADVYGGFALAALLGTYNFDEANSSYTAKFIQPKGIAAINLASAAVQAITGFEPAIGQSLTAGHMANTQVNHGGQLLNVEGSTLTPNVFIDEVHATDWIIARTEENVLSIKLNNKKIPYTDAGLNQLASAARQVMAAAKRAGIIGDDIDPVTGEFANSYEVVVPSVFSVAESQRKARIAPAIEVKFRYAGAVHYTTIKYQMTF